MDNKRFKVYITVFVITTVIASCFAVYFAIDSSNKDPENIAVGKVQSVATDEVDKTETKVQIKEIEKIIEKFTIPNIDSTKCLNPTEGYSYDVIRSTSGLNGAFNVFLESSDKVIVNYAPGNISTYFPQLNLGDSKTAIEKEIIFSNKKVKNIYFDGWGQAIGCETLFFIMDDGSVEYMPLVDALINNKFVSYGKVDGVENVVEMLSGSIRFVEGGGAHVVVAVTEEGSFYDVSTILNKTGKYPY